MNKMIEENIIMHKITRNICRVIAVMCLVGLIFAGTVSAENNTTVENVSIPITSLNDTVQITNGLIYSSPQDVPEEYSDYESWHKTEPTSGYYDDLINFDNSLSVTRKQVADLLLNERKSEEQRHREEYELMGLNDKLKRYINATKIKVGDNWYMKFEDEGNFFLNLFGYNFGDVYEGELALKQYKANLQIWLGVQSRQILRLEGY